MIEIKEYIDARGRSPYAKWFNRLNARAAAKVATALVRMGQGKLSNTKRVGAGVSEYRVDPGYRVYFGKEGEVLIILLGGGTKERQQKDIEAVQDLWRESASDRRSHGPDTRLQGDDQGPGRARSGFPRGIAQGGPQVPDFR